MHEDFGPGRDVPLLFYENTFDEKNSKLLAIHRKRSTSPQYQLSDSPRADLFQFQQEHGYQYARQAGNSTSPQKLFKKPHLKANKTGQGNASIIQQASAQSLLQNFTHLQHGHQNYMNHYRTQPHSPMGGYPGYSSRTQPQSPVGFSRFPSVHSPKHIAGNPHSSTSESCISATQNVTSASMGAKKFTEKTPDGKASSRARTHRAQSSTRKQILERLKRRTKSAGLVRKGRRSISEGSSPVPPDKIKEILQEAEENQEDTNGLARRKTVRFHPGRLGITFEGAIITEVVRNSQAEARGVKTGWKITKVANTEVWTELQICDVLDTLAARKIPYNVEMEVPSSSPPRSASKKREIKSPFSNASKACSPPTKSPPEHYQISGGLAKTTPIESFHNALRDSPKKRLSIRDRKKSSHSPSVRSQPQTRRDSKKAFESSKKDKNKEKEDIHISLHDDDTHESIKLKMCKFCHRNFSLARIDKHMTICSNLKNARKVMDKKKLGRKKTDKLGRRILVKN